MSTINWTAADIVRLRSHRYECEYKSESGFPFVTQTSFTRSSGAFTVTCTST